MSTVEPMPVDVDEESLSEVLEHPSSANRPYVMHNHYYHGPVHYIGQAHNASFGDNYGSITQTSHSSTPSSQPAALGSSIITPPAQHSPASNEITLSSLNPILDASHTRNLKVSPPHSRCLPGTREKVISMILSWTARELSIGEPHILWIYAYAGCGKSAISQAVGEQLAGEHRLAASFFFFRCSGDRSKVTRLITTIANQLANAVPATARLIEGAIRRNPRLLSLTTTSLIGQFESLVYQPIKAVAASLEHAPLTIVLDGVDECEDREEVSSFIKTLIAYFERDPSIPLRLVITSRVEDHIHQELRAARQVQLLDLASHTSDADIEVALDASLAKEKQGRMSLDIKQKLVKQIGRSYVFMSTILKELFKPEAHDGLAPMDRLAPILDASPDFDGLYMSLLRPLRRLPHFLDIISTISLAQEPISIAQIAELLELRTVDITGILVNLDSIIQFPGDDRSPVTFWHTSLRDFLTTEERAGPFFAAPEFHRRLAYRCIILAQGSTPSQCTKYAKRFAIEHLIKFVNSVDDDTDPFGGEGDHIMRLLEKSVFYRAGSTCENHGLEGACLAGEWKVVRALVNANINLDTKFTGYDEENGKCALHSVCYNGKIDLAMLMLDKGADPNIVVFTLCYIVGWNFYQSPLIWAVSKRHDEVVHKLLACGADPNWPGAGQSNTPLHHSVTTNNYEIACALLAHGADSDLRNSSGETPLHYACKLGRADFVELLIGHDANTSIADQNYKTPLRAARESEAPGTERIIEMLLRSGAREGKLPSFVKGRKLD
ncbi:hypothetical protein FA13DRAFT_1744494 [Coprinellus micaceus]|uniref:Nephrocystin 3-like N-terminal domain-containing protein n=1 Tax=Coprinellus micaceus TaxID=71717 RepID=A0A4Y7SEF4_COPMI|nr:hypothetical protein FA13DRAFT_1744494 [Coprinellus micaceus]